MFYGQFDIADMYGSAIVQYSLCLTDFDIGYDNLYLFIFIIIPENFINFINIWSFEKHYPFSIEEEEYFITLS